MARSSPYITTKDSISPLDDLGAAARVVCICPQQQPKVTGPKMPVHPGKSSSRFRRIRYLQKRLPQLKLLTALPMRRRAVYFGVVDLIDDDCRQISDRRRR